MKKVLGGVDGIKSAREINGYREQDNRVSSAGIRERGDSEGVICKPTHGEGAFKCDIKEVKGVKSDACYVHSVEGASDKVGCKEILKTEIFLIKSEQRGEDCIIIERKGKGKKAKDGKKEINRAGRAINGISKFGIQQQGDRRANVYKYAFSEVILGCDIKEAWSGE